MIRTLCIYALCAKYSKEQTGYHALHGETGSLSQRAPEVCYLLLWNTFPVKMIAIFFCIEFHSMF